MFEKKGNNPAHYFTYLTEIKVDDNLLTRVVS